jgi:O-antigen/teichoic acid export membrane protein
MVAINIPTMLLMQALNIWVINRIAPELRFGWRGASRQLVRTIISFSSSIFMIRVSARLQSRTDEIVTGAFLHISAVAPCAISRRLGEAAQLLADQFMKVLLPVASQLHAESDHARLHSLYIMGTRLTLAIFLPLGCILCVLTRPILTLWVGAAYADYAHLAIILTFAALIDTIHWPGGAVLRGTGRHRPMAVMTLCTALANLGLSVALVRDFGLTGVALGTLIPTLKGGR